MNIEHLETFRLDRSGQRVEDREELPSVLLDPRVYRSLWPRDEPPRDIDQGGLPQVLYGLARFTQSCG